MLKDVIPDLRMAEVRRAVAEGYAALEAFNSSVRCKEGKSSNGARATTGRAWPAYLSSPITASPVSIATGRSP